MKNLMMTNSFSNFKLEILNYNPFYKQHFQSNFRLNFRYLEIIHFLHPRYHPKIIGDILKNVQKLIAFLLMTVYD